MLIRPHDEGTDEAQWRSFVTDQGFGHFAVSRAGDVPMVVPTQFVLHGDEVVFHLAKPNPVFDALKLDSRGVMSVAGDWAYIPGGWRTLGDEDPSMGIPTTYYGAVQLIGSVCIVDESDGIAEVLRSQLAVTEPDETLQDPAAHQQRFKAIRGLRLSIDEVRSKFKYGANASVAHREKIFAQLHARNGPGDLAAASRIPDLSDEARSTDG